jgi:hypothetical protein
MGDFLQISKMAVEKGGSDREEVRVTRVVNLDNTPRILTGPNLATTNLNHIFGANNCKGHKTSELGILLDGVLIVLFDIVREVVHGDAVVLDILHHKLLRFGQFGGGKRIGTANDGNHIASGCEALHELDIEFS